MLATFAASKIHNFKHLGIHIFQTLAFTQQHLQQVEELETLQRTLEFTTPATLATSEEGVGNSAKELRNSPSNSNKWICKLALPKNSGIYPTTATSGFGSNLTLPRTLPLESFHRWHNHPTKVQSMKKKERKRERNHLSVVVADWKIDFGRPSQLTHRLKKDK
jgi:hypothetical protein